MVAVMVMVMGRMDSLLRRPTRQELATARAAFAAMFPRGADPRVLDGAEDLDLEAFVVESLRAMPASAALGFRAALAALALAPAVVVHRRESFAASSPQARLAVLERMARSDSYLARSAFTLLKATGALAFARSTRLRPGGSARRETTRGAQRVAP